VVFVNAKLPGVNFSFTNLARARLTGLDLEGANMTGAYLFLTQLGGTNLSRVTGLTQGQLDLACGTPETKLPQGLTRPKSWPCADEE